MASVVSEHRWRRPSSPDRIDRDLAELWADVGREAPVTRALMANLVIVCHTANDAPIDLEAAAAELPIDEVSRRHPSRVIVLQHVRDVPEACGPEAAAIGVLTFGPPQARYGIEHIAVRSACVDASLPSIVRRLTLGDVPTSIWLAEDVSNATPVEALVAMGRQLVYDSRQWRNVRAGAQTLARILAHERPPDIADLNWRRLLPFRQALVGAIDASGSAQHVATIDIRHGRGDAALAWLCLGWLRARGVVTEAGPIATVRETESDVVLSVALTGTAITAEMNSTRVLATYRRDAAPLVAAVPQETLADAVAAELRNLRRDVCLHDAVIALAHFPGGVFSSGRAFPR
jgi:glucose-6-phosphate dehydrogenase assembly protein OpcA